MPPRNTHQRRAIRQAIERAGRPLDANEVLEAANAENLGLATVYRTLKLGVEEGWLTPVELPNAPARYEMAGKQHHHHFECRNCQKVFEVHGCPGNLQPLVPEGFTLEDHEVILYGRCDQCPAEA
ncbi:MAG: Fur family transcriptional regulator [Phycisphaeraceae bacterium]